MRPNSPTTILQKSQRRQAESPGLARPGGGIARAGLGEPAAGNVKRWKAPFQKSGSVRVSEDKVDFLTQPEGPARTNIRVSPGDVVRARVTASTSGGISTRLMLTPSKGSGPIYEQGVVTEWVQGSGITLKLQLETPPEMKWMSIALDQPNWTEEQLPSDANGQPFPEAQMTGTISWTDAKITVNRPLGGGSLLGGFSTTMLLAGGAAVGAAALIASAS